MFEIELTQEAIDDLAALKKNDQIRVIHAIEAQLKHEPTSEMRSRKRLRQNEVAE